MEYYLLVIGVMSVITFILYLTDKAKAKKHQWRVPEKVLLGLSFLGGAVGGTIAMYTARHKTNHWYFVVVNIGSLLLHAGLFVYLFVL